jgi:hypothetical protein
MFLLVLLLLLLLSLLTWYQLAKLRSLLSM